jgi:hypothetical protein
MVTGRENRFRVRRKLVAQPQVPGVPATKFSKPRFFKPSESYFEKDKPARMIFSLVAIRWLIGGPVINYTRTGIAATASNTGGGISGGAWKRTETSFDTPGSCMVTP